MDTIQLIASLSALTMAIAFLVMVRKNHRLSLDRERAEVSVRLAQRTQWAVREANEAAYDLRHVRDDDAEPLAKAGVLVCETARTDAAGVTGIGAFLGQVRLYRTTEGTFLVRSELWLSSLPRRTATTEWSGWATPDEAADAYCAALKSWYRRDAHTDGARRPDERSAHDAPVTGLNPADVHFEDLIPDQIGTYASMITALCQPDGLTTPAT